MPRLPTDEESLIAPHGKQTRNSSMDDFHVITGLGYGGIGTVFLATTVHPLQSCRHNGEQAGQVNKQEEDQLVALKVMRKQDIVKRGCEGRVAMEKEVLCNIASVRQGPFLPSLRGHFESEEHEVLVLDYCVGGDLDVLRKAQSPDQRFSEAAARFYCAEVLLALKHLHELGYAYRDLKPENVLVCSTGHIMLSDFDLCAKMHRRPGNATSYTNKRSLATRCMRELTSTLASCMGAPAYQSESRGKEYSDLLSGDGRSYSLVGTEEYVAPEMLWRIGHDFSVDWWALGVFLYELVSGTTPFRGRNRNETFHSILSKSPKLWDTWSPSLCDLISKLLIKQPCQRLGFQDGASEIMSHSFFHGVCWNELQHLARPPFIPPPATDNLSPESTTFVGSSSIALDFQAHLAMVEELYRMPSTAPIISNDISSPFSPYLKVISSSNTASCASDRDIINSTANKTSILNQSVNCHPDFRVF